MELLDLCNVQPCKGYHSGTHLKGDITMNKKLPVLILTGALACAMTLPAMAAEPAAGPISAPVSNEETQALADSVLYYGTVEEIVRGEDGSISRLRMTSERYGEYVMILSEQTVWIDSGERTAADPADLQEGEGVYVFHSTAATMSLPPQSPALAVVRNVPMDAGCAQYHEVEAVSLENGCLTITTDNGGLLIRADEKTGLSRYGSEDEIALEDIQPGSWIMAWYDAVAESYPGQTNASHLMLLSQEAAEAGVKESEELTRAELVSIIHETAGKPAVNYAMDYADVSEDADYAEAIRWATSEELVKGYDNGSFGPEDPVSREQLVTILWRYAGSPMLMDYPGLTQFSDIGELSDYAQPAMAWAHQKGFIGPVEGDLLAPGNPATLELAEQILSQLA